MAKYWMQRDGVTNRYVKQEGDEIYAWLDTGEEPEWGLLEDPDESETFGAPEFEGPEAEFKLRLSELRREAIHSK